MNDQYRNNHYVPIWYQKRFLPHGTKDQELYYLDLKPETFKDPRGVSHRRDRVRPRGFSQCFCIDDLYTTRFGEQESREIERAFFSGVDSDGKKAVEYWGNFSHPWDGKNHLHELLLYMSTQKLRTPKGLGWLREKVRASSTNETLAAMLAFQRLYCAIWTECIWQIADASESPTKFIVSDHPITLYNRSCGPRSTWCREFNDPDIRLHGSHTIFPLSLEKVLILTNLSWVRNPYQSEIGWRPNPEMFRNAMFNFMDIQTNRKLTEQEVREINFIIKNRAYRYIGSAKKEWLYPEEYVTKSDWATYGKGYLLMPDPRGVSYSTEILIGFNDGRATGFDEYGRRPWQKGYSGSKKRVRDDWNTFHRFQGEFARLHGPFRRGRKFEIRGLENERDSDDYHQYHLSLEAKFRRAKNR